MSGSGHNRRHPRIDNRSGLRPKFDLNEMALIAVAEEVQVILVLTFSRDDPTSV